MQSISPTRNEVIFDFIVNFGQLCGEAASMNVALLTQSPYLPDADMMNHEFHEITRMGLAEAKPLPAGR
ncbi:MAG: hypothetical protein MJZ97_02630 [Bacteroidales bacterium]|nr:hypothetical protein [Bacteroidales bacterium]